MPKCPTVGCGADLPEGAKECLDCGIELGGETEVRRAPPPPSPPVNRPRTHVVPAAPRALARVTVMNGPVPTHHVFPLGERNIVGRFGGNGPVDVDLEEVPGAISVSRPHAEIWRNEV